MNDYDLLREDVGRILTAPLFYTRREVVMAGAVQVLLDENEKLRAIIAILVRELGHHSARCPEGGDASMYAVVNEAVARVKALGDAS